ncbi:MAG: trigger factor [Monoglobales bacterium]
MAVKTEDVEKNLVKLTFEVSAEDFTKAINEAYKKNAKKFNIPGFRKGKAPRAVIEKYYTEAVFYDDAINAVLPGAYESAVKEAELEVVARPEIDVEDIKKGEPVVFTALVTTKPEVKLGEYKGVEVAAVDATVTDEDVDKDIAATQQKNARMIEVDDRAVENGDIITLDFEGSVDGVPFDGGKGEDYELEIGSGTFIPGFEDQLVGAEIGADVNVNVTFPEEYHAENLKGKDAVFACKVKNIKVRELPELDDDFASEVSEFETMADYRADVRKKLEEAAENKAKAEIENEVIEKVVENAEFDLPDAMIDAQVDNTINDFAQRLQYQGMNLDMYLQYTGSNLEAMKAQFRPQAEKQVSGSLVLEAVMNAEGIETTPEELELELVDMSKKYNMELDKIKELLQDAEMERIKKDLALQKTITMLVNNAVVK